MKLSLIISVLLITGCTFHRGSLKRSDAKAAANAASLVEESRALTTGALDALGHAPTNPPTTLAKNLLQRDQQIEGLPVKRIDVDGILAGHSEALADLTNRLAGIDALLQDRVRIQTENSQLRDKLVEMGKLYEEERNKTVLKRVFAYLGVGGSIAAIIALFVFFPPALAIAGHLIGWIVSKLPGLASWVGVVSVKAFDQVVSGVEKAKAAIGRESTEKLEAQLGREMDKPYKAVVRIRKAALKPL